MPLPRIAIHIPFISAYCRQVLRGIADFAHTTVPWQFVGSPVYARQSGHLPPMGDCDGIITHASRPEEVDFYRQAPVPVVNVSSIGPPTCLPRVCVANAGIGRVGCEHLLDMGLRHLAYIEPAQGPCFAERRQAFIQTAIDAGADVEWLGVPGRWDEGCWVDEDRRRQLPRFIRRMPRPLGLMAPHDALAYHAIGVCRQLDLQVPAEVAILGVGNDELVCDFSHPSLSSVDVNARRIGYEAAGLLHQFLDGRRPDSTDIHIQPHNVVQRESTDVVAVEDPIVGKAVRFIRAHACKGISVVDVVSEVPLERRAFERRFLRYMRRTPLKEIRRVQMDAARFLLERTDYPVSTIARRSGFRDAKYFSKAFRAAVGQTPAEYRQHNTSRVRHET